MAKSPGK